MSSATRRYLRRQLERGILEASSRVRSWWSSSRELRLSAQPQRPGASAALLKVPNNNRLGYIQKWSTRYDFWLPRLMSMVSQKWPTEHIVDVGANVGDTLFAARLAGCDVPYVAIEASAQFAQLLRANIAANRKLALDVEVVEALVVGKSTAVEFQVHRKGTGKTTPPGQSAVTAATGGAPRSIRLADLGLSSCSFLKIDTDGFDAYILEGSLPWLQRLQPVIWAETEIGSRASLEVWRSVLAELVSIGYDRYVLFDNEGALCCEGRFDSFGAQCIMDLIAYSFTETERFARGERLKKPIHYFDLALFPTGRAEVQQEFTARVRAGESGTHP